MPDEPQPEESAETAAVETTAAPAEDAAAEDTTEQKKPTETVEFWKSKAREQEKRAKENAAAAKRLADLEESQKSETQKLLERAEAAEGVAYALKAAEEIRDLKAGISKRYKDAGYDIPASALRGSDAEELEEHALELKALLPEPRKPGQVSAEGRTVTTGTGDPAQQFAELIRNARK